MSVKYKIRDQQGTFCSGSKFSALTLKFMIRVILSLFYLVLTFNSFGQDRSELYPFRDGERWGYINSSGTPIIPATFLSAGDFSEGLAPVRVGGRFGYINAKGKIQIAPKFDYAESFMNGLGKVWLDGKPFFVGKNGKLTYGQLFLKVVGFQEGSERAIATIKYHTLNPWSHAEIGLIDRRGRLIAKTLFPKIEKWTENRYICHFRQGDSVPRAFRNSSNTNGKNVPAICVLDSNGMMIIPTGLFSSIKKEDNNLASVVVIGETTLNALKFITLQGNVIVFPIEKRNSSDKFHLEWSEDRASGCFLLNPNDPQTQAYSPKASPISGWFDEQGRFIFPDSTLEFTSPFQNNRAFGRIKKHGSFEKDRYHIYDRVGNRVGVRTFQQFCPFWDYRQNMYLGFWEGVAVVRTDSGSVEMIDTMGNTIRDLGKHFYMPISIKPGAKLWEFNALGGSTMIWDREKNKFIEPQMLEVEVIAIHENFLFRGCDWYGKLKYMDRAGNIIWEEKAHALDPKRTKLNSDQLLDGPQFIGMEPFSQGTEMDSVFIAIKLDDTISYRSKYAAFAAYFTNNSKDSISFQYNWTIQVLNAKKEWQDILHRPVSFCGVGQDIVHYLAPGDAIKLAVPDLDGEIETQLRLGLVVGGKYLCSNPVKIKINPGQFWRKPTYSRAGILKRYKDEVW